MYICIGVTATYASVSRLKVVAAQVAQAHYAQREYDKAQVSAMICVYVIYLL